MLSKVYVENMFRNHHRKRKGNEAVKLDTNVFNTFYAPNFEKVGSILLSACACIRPSVQKKIKLGF